MTLNYRNVSNLLRDKIREIEDKIIMGGRNEEFFMLCSGNLQDALSQLDNTVYNNKLNSDPLAQDNPDAEITNPDDYITEQDLRDAMLTLGDVEKLEYRKLASENSLAILGITLGLGFLLGFVIGKKKVKKED